VRLGTAEFYRVVEELPEVVDSLVVHLEDPSGGNGELLLFVQIREEAELDDALRRTIATLLRTSLSPRHIPDSVIAVPAIRATAQGEARVAGQEDPSGCPARRCGGRDVLADPASLDAYVAQAAERRSA